MRIKVDKIKFKKYFRKFLVFGGPILVCIFFFALFMDKTSPSNPEKAEVSPEEASEEQIEELAELLESDSSTEDTLVEDAEELVIEDIVEGEGEEVEEGEAPPAPEYTIIKVEAEQAQRTLLDMIAFFNERNITIASLEILEPNLESVFLHLTGKKLRE